MVSSKSNAGDGVITEEEAAKLPAADGEKEANDLAAAHAKRNVSAADSSVIWEEDAAKESWEAAQERSNDLAAEHAAEDEKDPWQGAVITEAEVVKRTRAAEKRAAAAGSGDDVTPAKAKSAPKTRRDAKAEPVDYESKTVAELKDLANTRGLTVDGGLKADYVSALEAADQ